MTNAALKGTDICKKGSRKLPDDRICANGDISVRRKNEPEKPGPDATILEIEQYELEKNRIKVNIYDSPARMSFVYGGLSLLAAVIGMIWNFVRPIVRGDFIPGFEGFFYAFNIYRIVSGYLYAVLIIVFSIVAFVLFKKSAEAGESSQPFRKAGLICGIIAAAMQPVSMLIVTVQAISYLATFN
ncbi:MAG: hypothetical protein IJL30_08335 [Clostridia bacterium]|nr:hypothetical protein [Clostridia bacterium]